MRALFRRRFGTASVQSLHVLDEGSRARVHFLVHKPDGLPELDNRELEREAGEHRQVRRVEAAQGVGIEQVDICRPR